ncbi:hypothetical protein ACAD28_01578 [Clavibacter nebraskensis]|uniref:bifunctional DNA primase/polymerase n=1 Tax=Clavibacter nebraskensis TaxID=31963 RepID=UPI003DA103A5
MPSIRRPVKSIVSLPDAIATDEVLIETDTLRIPDVSGLATVDAALAYAGAGLFVGPVRAGTKSPGDLLGGGWQGKTSTAPEVIRGWYLKHPTAGVFIHTGPSRLVVFDLDKTETLDELPPELAAALRVGVFQRSRGTGDRGHYVFSTDERLSNSAGAFSAWGDVRAGNGVIVTAPSVHPGTGTPYLWVDAGPVPPLPAALRALLRSGGPEARPALKPSQQDAFFAKHTAATRPEALQGPLTNFSARAADGESRHMALATVLPWALREARQGLYSARAVFEQFGAAFLASFETGAEGSRPGPAPGEFENTFSWAAAQPTPAETAESLWELSPQLARIRRHALKQMVTPWSLLGVGILRSLAAVPPSHVLPDIVGTTAPPNLFVGLVGASGAGKGSAEGVARDVFQWSEAARSDVRPGQPGSGEGIPKMFGSYQAKAGGVEFQHTRVLMSVSEIDSLAALFKRDSSTLSSTLRALWSGETLGNDYSAKDNRVIVRAKRYRAGLLVGIQPDHAQPLFDDATGGLLQRFVFVGTQDPSQPAPPEAAGEVDVIRLPEWRGEDLASWLNVMGREVEEGESVSMCRRRSTQRCKLLVSVRFEASRTVSTDTACCSRRRSLWASPCCTGTRMASTWSTGSGPSC